MDYYFAHENLYQNLLKEYLVKDLNRSEAFSVLRLLGVFDKSPPSPVDCEKFEQLIKRNTSQELIKALKEFNDHWYQQECVESLIRHFYQSK